MKSKIAGYLFIFLSVFVYGLYGIFTRKIAESFGAFNIQFFREGLTALIILLLTAIGISKWGKILKEDIKYLLMLGVISTIGNVCMYYVYQLLPLGIASFTTYASIIVMSLLLGLIIFKEKINSVGIISLILAIIGLVTMFEIRTAGLNIWGIVAGLAFGLMISTFATFTKKLKGDYGPLQVYMIAAIITAIASLIISLVIKESFPIIEFNNTWLWVLIFAIAAVFANGLYILGLQQGVDISIASIIMPMESVTAAVTGILFFSEKLGIRGIVGAFIILIASIIPQAVEWIKMKKKITL